MGKVEGRGRREEGEGVRLVINQLIPRRLLALLEIIVVGGVVRPETSLTMRLAFK